MRNVFGLVLVATVAISGNMATSRADDLEDVKAQVAGLQATIEQAQKEIPRLNVKINSAKMAYKRAQSAESAASKSYIEATNAVPAKTPSAIMNLRDTWEKASGVSIAAKEEYDSLIVEKDEAESLIRSCKAERATMAATLSLKAELNVAKKEAAEAKTEAKTARTEAAEAKTLAVNLRTDLTTETQERKKADARIKKGLKKETDARIAGDEKLQKQINEDAGKIAELQGRYKDLRVDKDNADRISKLMEELDDFNEKVRKAGVQSKEAQEKLASNLREIHDLVEWRYNELRALPPPTLTYRSVYGPYIDAYGRQCHGWHSLVVR